MIAFLLLAPMMLLTAGMSLLAGLAGILSVSLSIVMGMITTSVVVCSTALVGALIFILS